MFGGFNAPRTRKAGGVIFMAPGGPRSVRPVRGPGAVDGFYGYHLCFGAYIIFQTLKTFFTAPSFKGRGVPA